MTSKKTNRYMLGKCLMSGAFGIPTGILINISVLPLFALMLIDHPVQAVILITLVNTAISVTRLFIIEKVEDSYGLNVKPSAILTKLTHCIKRKN